jgi:tRNA nucleotidyltransferase (CCA-adding enzyme)
LATSAGSARAEAADFAIVAPATSAALETAARDLDIVVEGDAHELAIHLHRLLGGRLTLHSSFGTASVRLKSGRLDFTSARGETYPQPAALPRVFFSTLKDDLFRRDFTINAMAVQLNPSRFGRLVDFFGGKEDLDSGRVRVLHEASFLDDPTRIYRAVRFEQRLGFRLDEETERLLRGAVAGGLISRLSPARARDQLRLLFSEEDPVAPALRADELGLFASLNPRLGLAPQAEAVLRATSSAISVAAQAQATVPSSLRWLLFLLPLTLEMRLEEAEELAAGLRLSRAESEALVETIVAAKPTLDVLSALRNPSASEVWALLQPLHEIILVHLLARCHQRSAVRSLLLAHLTQYRHIALEINGDDLQKAGFPAGPALGKALRQTLKSKVDGHVSTKSEELSFAISRLESSADF